MLGSALVRSLSKTTRAKRRAVHGHRRPRLDVDAARLTKKKLYICIQRPSVKRPHTNRLYIKCHHTKRPFIKHPHMRYWSIEVAAPDAHSRTAGVKLTSEEVRPRKASPGRVANWKTMYKTNKRVSAIIKRNYCAFHDVHSQLRAPLSRTRKLTSP